MNLDPKISVIIPVYNVELYLRECLDSVINQTLKEIEIICVDDGSTDNSLEILQEYAKNDDRIIIIEQENSGAGVARNVGLDIAKGEYLSFLDADDFFHLEMLEKAYAQASYLNAEICVFKSNSYNTKENLYREIKYAIKCDFENNQLFRPKDINDNIFKCFVGWAWDKLFLTDFVKTNNLKFQNLRSTNDMFFVYASIVTTNKITILNEVLAYHRVGLSTSISNTRELSWQNFYLALMEVKKYLINVDLYDYYRIDFINYALHSSLWNLNTLEVDTAKLLYNKLRDEWFKELQIDTLRKDDFNNKKEYDEYSNINLMIFENSKYSISSDNPIKVSVVMPSLNVIQYIKECIESVINQTLKEIEIICVDAGSTDGTLEMLHDYANKDSRIKIIISDKRSYGYQMNLGISHAKGDYIGIVETDDYILPNMYETLYNTAILEQVQVVKSDYCKFYTSNGFLEKEFKNVSKNDNWYNKKLNPSQTPDLISITTLNQLGVFSLNLIKWNNIKFNETPGASFQDNGFHFQIFCFAESLYLTKNTFYMLRRDNPNSSVLSFGNHSKLYCMCDEYDLILEFLNKNPYLKEKFKVAFAKKCFGNYEFVLNSTSQKLKKEFLYKFSSNFTKYKNMNLYKIDDFTSPQKEKLQQILDDPIKYYNSLQSKPNIVVKNSPPPPPPIIQYKLSTNNSEMNKTNGQLRWARGELYKIRTERLELKKELAQIKGIKSSFTYKLGRFITWLPRTIRDLFKTKN